MSEGLRFKISWEQFQQDAKALAWKLKPIPLVGIIAMTRGGMIPAALVAYELGVKYIDTYCVSSYDDQTSQQSYVTNLKQPLLWNHELVVVIDDLVDTGATFTYAQQLLPRCHYAAVYAKPLGKPSVDTFVTEVSQDTWIDFPWE